MARPSRIDRLPEEVREQIGKLRRKGRSIDDILAKLRELLPEAEQPSRSSLGRHVQKIDVLGERIRANREMANALVDRLGDGAESKLTRLNAELLQGALTNLMVSDDGQPVTLDAKDAAFLAAALQRIASASKTDAELVAKIRLEMAREAGKKLDKVAKDAAAAGEKGLSKERIDQLRRELAGTA